MDNIYETININPTASNSDNENIYESVDELLARRAQRIAPEVAPGAAAAAAAAQEPPPDRAPSANDMPGCSTYGRIGNVYGRIDIIGHGIGRIERHLSSSCGSIDSNHYAIESLYGTSDSTGRISKVSVQWLLVNKWLPLWIANTETGRDYRIIDFLLGERGDYENIPRRSEDKEGEGQGEHPPPGPQS